MADKTVLTGTAEETEDAEEELRYDGITCLLLAMHIENHLSKDEEMRSNLETIHKESKIPDLTDKLFDKVKPLLASRKAKDVKYAVSYIVNQAWEKGVRDGMTECYIQCLTIAQHALDEEKGEDEDGQED